jgi:hypothetical protein
VNPQVSFTPEAIIDLAKQLEEQAIAALGPDWHLPLYLNPSTVLPDILFQASASGDCPIVHPHPPLRHCLHGFGMTNPNLKIAHSTPSVYFILHLAWLGLSSSQ